MLQMCIQAEKSCIDVIIDGGLLMAGETDHKTIHGEALWVSLLQCSYKKYVSLRLEMCYTV